MAVIVFLLEDESNEVTPYRVWSDRVSAGVAIAVYWTAVHL